MLQLRLPSPACREQIWEYREEFLRNNDSMDGTNGLQKAESFEAWYEQWKNMLDEKTVKKGLVPSTTFLAVECSGPEEEADGSGRLVGMVDIRHRLNDALLQSGGHIGYSVRKSERRKGYATEMLRLALEEAGKFGIEKVLITCSRDNIGSARTIKNNGGVLENETAENGRVTQRYWIVL